MKTFNVAAFLVFAMISGCALPSLDYHPYTHPIGGGGYKEKHLGGDQWVVTYVKAGGHDRATVTEFVLRRAKEVCQEHGYRKYRINGDIVFDQDVTVIIGCLK